MGIETLTIYGGNYKRLRAGVVVYSEFGELKDVHHGPGWVTLENTEGWVVSMKKVYHGWAYEYQYAQSLIGSKIIIETGASSSANDYFRSVYKGSDDFGQSHFTMPEDAGPAAEHELLRLRLYSDRKSYRISSLQKLAEEQHEELEASKQKDSIEVQKAIKMLDKEWDDWVANPIRSVSIMGKSYNHSDLPKKIDISFAMRLRLDVTKKKRTNIRVLGRIEGTNKVNVELMDYDNLQCTMALKQSNHHNTLNEWCVATVMNHIEGWHKVENSKKFKNYKQKRKPIEFFLAAHDEILEVAVDRAWDNL